MGDPLPVSVAGADRQSRQRPVRRRLFCSQAHAAEWFRQPLPDPVPGPAKRHRASIADRLPVIAIGAVVVWMALLALIGLWTVIRWLWHS